MKSLPSKKTAVPDLLTATVIQEAAQHAAAAARHLRSGCAEALQAGLRLLWLHQNTVSDGQRSKDTGFDSAITKIGIAKTTAYRWSNAAYSVLCRDSGIQADDADEYILPRPGSADWKKAEKILIQVADGMSLRRLMLGAPASGDINRLENLISDAEAGDTVSETVLDQIERGEINIVQGIRSAAGAKATKNKTRNDPVYLDLDSSTGQPKGLFFRSLVTIASSFSHFDQAPDSAKAEAKKAWKELVSHLPKELK